MRFKNKTLLTFLAFLLSILGLVGPGFWDIKSPNPIKFTNDHLTRATLGLKFNPNILNLDNKFKNSKISSGNYFGKEIAIAWSKNFIDQRVRPAVAMDGGDISFCSFEDGVVTLQMKGACAGCPSSTATLKMGIENMLRHYIPEVVEVKAAEM